MLTIKEARKYINDKLPKEIRKRLRPSIDSVTYKRKDGCQVHFYTPSFITLVIDDKFEINENELTYTLRNRKVHVTIFKDQSVEANIVIY